MLSALRNGDDLHRIAASGLFNKSEEAITDAERKIGKTINFSILFGASASKVAETFKIPRRQAQKQIDGYFAKFSKLKEMQENSFNFTLEHGYILIDHLGRRSYIPEFDKFNALGKLALSGNPELKKEYLKLEGRIFRTASNFIIQGAAAGMSKRAGILLRSQLKLYPELFKIVGFIHDEYVVECKIEYAKRVKTIVEDCMAEAAREFCTSIQVPADAIITNKWNK